MVTTGSDPPTGVLNGGKEMFRLLHGGADTHLAEQRGGVIREPGGGLELPRLGASRPELDGQRVEHTALWGAAGGG